METIFVDHVLLVFFSADEEKKHVYTLDYFIVVWFFSFLWFGVSLMCNLYNFCRHLMSVQLMSLTVFKTRDTQLFFTLDVYTIDVFDKINTYRHYCKGDYSHKEELRHESFQ